MASRLTTTQPLSGDCRFDPCLGHLFTSSYTDASPRLVHVCDMLVRVVYWIQGTTRVAYCNRTKRFSPQ